jgi:hypothetical protein
MHTRTFRLITPILLGLAAVSGCDLADDGFQSGPTVLNAFAIDAGISEHVQTSARIEWRLQLEDVQDAYVEYGLDGELDQIAEVAVDGAEFTASLIALKPGREYTIRATVVSSAGTYASSDEILTTATVPSLIPDIEVSYSSLDGPRPGYLVSSIVKERSTAVILDGEGDVVWWHPKQDVPGVISRATLSQDQTAVVYLMERTHEDMLHMPTELVRVSLDGSEMRTHVIPGAHHDMVELPDGTVGAIVFDQVQSEFGTHIVDRIDELSPDGDVRTVWSASDWIEFDPDLVAEAAHDDMGYTHANALDYDEDLGAYLIGLRNLDMIVAVERSSGEVLFQIGGKGSDYESTETTERFFEGQHQFHLEGDSLLVFDNGPASAYESRAVEYLLDDEEGTAEPVFVHLSDPPVFCTVLGDVDRLPSGNTMVTWSSAGQLDEVTPDGEVVWRLQLAYGAALGYTTHVDHI